MGRLALCLALAASALSVMALSQGGTALFTAAQSIGSNTFSADSLDAPAGLTATAGAGGGTIDLSWTATADTYASGHRVYRATTPGGPYDQAGELTPRTTATFQDSGLTGGTTYYYVVRAFYQAWQSADSNEASATAP